MESQVLDTTCMLFLVKLQEEFKIGHPWEWKGSHGTRRQGGAVRPWECMPKEFDASRCKNGIGRQAGSTLGAAGTKSCVLFWMRQRLLLVSYSDPRWRDINYEGVGNHTRQNSLRLPPHSSFCSCFASPPRRSDERTQTNLRGTFRSCHKNNADKRARVRLSDFCAVAFHVAFVWVTDLLMASDDKLQNCWLWSTVSSQQSSPAKRPDFEP